MSSGSWKMQGNKFHPQPPPRNAASLLDLSPVNCWASNLQNGKITHFYCLSRQGHGDVLQQQWQADTDALIMLSVPSLRKWDVRGTAEFMILKRLLSRNGMDGEGAV